MKHDAPTTLGSPREAASVPAAARKTRVDLGKIGLWVPVAFTSLFFLAPIFTVVLTSFSSGEYIVFPPQIPLSLKWYRAFFDEPLYTSALGNSLRIGAWTAAVSLVVGSLAALGIVRKHFRGEDVVYFLLFLPFLVPGIVLGLGILTSLQPLGLSSLRESPVVVVVAHSLWATPIVLVIMVAVLRGIDPRVREAAAVLGAGPVRTFFEVTLPLAKSGVLASAILAFVISFHEFVMALFLTGPSTVTLPVVVWNSLRFEVRPIIAAIDSLMIGSVVLALVLIAKLVGIEKIRVR